MEDLLERLESGKSDDNVFDEQQCARLLLPARTCNSDQYWVTSQDIVSEFNKLVLDIDQQAFSSVFNSPNTVDFKFNAKK